MASVLFNISKLCYNNPPIFHHICRTSLYKSPQLLISHAFQNTCFQHYSRKSPAPESKQKLTLVQRFKQMYRDYWYVLVPVHLVTSAGWFGGLYYLAKSGVDVVSLLENLHVSEKVTNPLKDSSVGYLAVAYALYKIATPIRYTVTLGGTTISINYLKKWGYIKPVPSATQLKEMYKESKENILETLHEYKVKDVKKDSESDKRKTVNDVKSNKYEKISKNA